MTGQDAAVAGAPAAAPKRKKASPLSRRGAARLAAVQALYQIELTDAEPPKVVAEFLRARLDPNGRDEETVVVWAYADRDFFQSIVFGATAARATLDDAINAAMTNDWRVARLEPVLRAALRAGGFEISGRLDVPTAAIVNEYVEVVRDFSSEDAPGFAHAVLDRLARVERG